MTSDELLNRLLSFAVRCQKLVKKLSNNAYNREYEDQLVRSAASPGANYIEAIEASSKKDFVYRLKVCRKEIKESIYWLTLIQSANEDMSEFAGLINEAGEYVRIFTSSIITAEKNMKISK